MTTWRGGKGSEEGGWGLEEEEVVRIRGWRLEGAEGRGSEDKWGGRGRGPGVIPTVYTQG